MTSVTSIDTRRLGRPTKAAFLISGSCLTLMETSSSHAPIYGNYHGLANEPWTSPIPIKDFFKLLLETAVIQRPATRPSSIESVYWCARARYRLQ